MLCSFVFPITEKLKSLLLLLYLGIVVVEGEGGLLEIAVEAVGLGIVVAPETVVEAVLGIAAVEADLETEADLEKVEEDVLAETVAVVDTVEDSLLEKKILYQ